jgi:hypothetical protein
LDDIFCKEKQIDFIKRNKDLMNKIGNNSNTTFIVIATPIEETGRDHSFNWGIGEVSSSMSLVQWAGRINRHNPITISKPNIHVLRFNFKAMRSKHSEEDHNEPIYIYPGLEKEEAIEHNDVERLTHPDHDLKKLFNWEKDILVINASLRFNSYFAECDDVSISYDLSMAEDVFFGTEATTQVFGKYAYNKYSLRDSNDDDTWRTIDGKTFERLELVNKKFMWIEKDDPFSGNIYEVLHPRSWGVVDIKSMREISVKKLSDYRLGMEFSIPQNNKNYFFDHSFGFYRHHIT